MQLRRRLAFIAGAYLVILVLGALFTAGALRTWTKRLDDRRILLTAAERVATLRSAYLDEETGVRGYVISGDRTFLTPYSKGTANAATLTSDLRLELPATGVPLTTLDAVDVAIDDWTTQAAKPAIAERARNVSQATLQPLMDRSKALFDTVRQRLDDLTGAVDQRGAMVTATVNSARWMLIIIVSVVFALAVVLTVISFGLLRRWIVVPLATIADAANRIGHGEDATLLTSGPPEMRNVANAIDRMQRTIRSQRDEAVNAREAFEQNAVIALRLRDELAHDVGEYPPGWQVAAGARPAQGLVAGDCYDVWLLGPSSIGVVILDIAGHGALAAVSAFKCKELLNVALRNGLDPGAALNWLAEQDVGLADSFFTAFLAAIDTDTGLCLYANAGHPPAVLTGPDGLDRQLLPTGPLFGPVPPGWQTADAVIEPGAMLVVYTDGLVETRSTTRDFYGEERLSRTLDDMEHDAGEVVAHVLDDVATFRGGKQADDVTIVVLAREQV